MEAIVSHPRLQLALEEDSEEARSNLGPVDSALEGLVNLRGTRPPSRKSYHSDTIYSICIVERRRKVEMDIRNIDYISYKI